MISNDKQASGAVFKVETDVSRVASAWRRQLSQQGPSPCPVCQHKPQLRKHVFTGTMTKALIYLHHRVEPADAESMPEEVKTGDSLKKLLLWRLAVEAEGKYQLTAAGLDAVLLRAKVPLECVAAHGTPMWFSGPDSDIWLNESLNQRYSYDEMMAPVPA